MMREIAVSDMELARWRETATTGDHPFYELLMAGGRIPKNAKPLDAYHNDALDAMVYKYEVDSD